MKTVDAIQEILIEFDPKCLGIASMINAYPSFIKAVRAVLEDVETDHFDIILKEYPDTGNPAVHTYLHITYAHLHIDLTRALRKYQHELY